MKTYKVMINGQSVMKSWGRNENEARERARELLNRPGRYAILAKWTAAGERLEVVK